MPYGSVGGMERLALSFYNHYISIGYEVKAMKFIALKDDIINFGKDELFLKNIDFSQMSKFERMAFYFSIPRLIKKVVKKHAITHTISFGDMANFFSSLSYSQEFKVASIHALKSVEFTNKSFFNKIFKLSYKTTYKRLDKVVCISKDIKEDLISKCGFKFVNKLEVIYNPHDLKLIEKKSLEPIENKNELELFAQDSILFLGRLSIQKSPWHLIEAFNLVLETRPNTNLIFIGDGDIHVEAFLKEKIKILNIENKVFFLGRKNNPYKYLAKANLLALSSHYEGTPNVIVESICVGVPIVSSFCTKGIIELMGVSSGTTNDLGQNIDVESGIITPNLFQGKLGIPIEKNIINHEERKLSEAIISVLLNTKYKKTLNNNKELLLAKFNLEKVCKKYLEINS